MKTLKTLLLMTLLLTGSLLAMHASAQEMIAEVDRQNIGLNDTLTLTVRQSGRTVSGGPDFDALQRDFEILGNQRSQQMRIVNGDMQSWTEWRLTLSPRRAGDLTIPEFEFDGQRSESIQVSVEERQQQPDRGDEDIFVEAELSKERSRVQEQVLFTVRLYSRVNLDGAEIQPLELDDVVIKAVNEDNYITNIDGRQHIVLETTFALFPQRSGTLDIPALVYDLAVSRGQRDFWGRSTRQRVRTEALSLEVEPVAAEFSGDTWLPARNISLSESWSTEPDQLRQGEPVTRRITLEADGLTAAQLPNLSLDTHPAVTLYPDRPQTDEQLSTSGVRSRSEITVAMVPNKSGRITLPPITLQWWDTEAERMRTAEIPPSTIEVAADPDARSDDRERNERRPDSADEESPPATAEPEPAPLLTWLLALTSTVLLGLCLWLAVTVWRLKKTLTDIHNRHQQTQDQGRIARSRTWHSVKRAAKANDLHALRRALLDWGAVLWPQSPPRGLNDLADRLDDETARVRVQELDAILFKGDESGASFDTDALLSALQQSRAGQKPTANEEDGLRPLYRNR